MGTNNKNSPSNDRTFFNGSPSNNSKKSSSGSQQRPSPSKSINIKTPNKNQSFNNVAGLNSFSNNSKLSGSCSPPNFSYFAASKCFESPSPQSLPKPPTSWFDEAGKKRERGSRSSTKTQNARRQLNLTMADTTKTKVTTSCAAEFAKTQQNSSFAFANSNDHYTQNLKLLLNVNA